MKLDKLYNKLAENNQNPPQRLKNTTKLAEYTPAWIFQSYRKEKEI